MAATCDYCMSAKSVLVGNVYCSKHHPSMEPLRSGALLLRSSSMESEEHVSRLSIRCVLNGHQYYRLGSHDHMISPDTYLIINQGQTYKTSFAADYEIEMLLVAFQPDFAEQLLYSLVTPDDRLLDNPFGSSKQPVLFFEQAYPVSPHIRRTFARLRDYIAAPHAQDVDLDTLYTNLLTHLLYAHRDVHHTIGQLSPVKHSTRVELYRRLTVAKDYIDAHLHTDIDLDTVSRIACISKYHFLRLFREAYGRTPHRYITERRLERAAFLLKQTGRPVTEICREVGFEDGGSFGRLFRRTYGRTPTLYRRHTAN